MPVFFATLRDGIVETYGMCPIGWVSLQLPQDGAILVYNSVTPYTEGAYIDLSEDAHHVVVS